MLIAQYTHNILEAGCDEAGRGCLAGPVFAAAVILSKDFHHPKLNDSKKLSERDRDVLRPIIESEAISYGVGQVSESEIDQINILNASFLAMHRAIEDLSVRPEHLLIDGNRFKPYQAIPHTCIVQGDSKYRNIAAASILAKTYRDEHMRSIAAQYPGYGWSQNKGYATLAHRIALQEHGPTVYHRRSFVVKRQLKLPFDT